MMVMIMTMIMMIIVMMSIICVDDDDDDGEMMMVMMKLCLFQSPSKKQGTLYATLYSYNLCTFCCKWRFTKTSANQRFAVGKALCPVCVSCLS